MNYNVRAAATIGFDIEADSPEEAREKAVAILRRFSETDDTMRAFADLYYPFVEPADADADYPSLEIERD